MVGVKQYLFLLAENSLTYYSVYEKIYKRVGEGWLYSMTLYRCLKREFTRRQNSIVLFLLEFNANMTTWPLLWFSSSSFHFFLSFLFYCSWQYDHRVEEEQIREKKRELYICLICFIPLHSVITSTRILRSHVTLLVSKNNCSY